MKTAYLILAHKNPNQLTKLIQALSTQSTFFFIHLDLKSNIDEFSCVTNLERVFFCAERTAINWGGWSMVSATLDLMHQARRLQCERYHLLSGQDYPLKSNLYLEKFFDNDKIFMNYFRMPAACWNEGGMVRFEQYHFVDLLSKVHPVLRHLAQSFLRFINKLKTRNMPYNLVPYGGSQWWSITDECVDFIFDYIYSHKCVEPFFKRTLIPDEFLFQTLIMNSPLKVKVVNDNQRHIEWDVMCPSTFGSEMYQVLLNSNNCFARKFDADVDDMVFDAIDIQRQQVSSTDTDYVFG